MILDKIYVSKTEPVAANVLWVKPLEGGAFSLYAFLSGKWGLLKLMNDNGTPYPDDDTPGGSAGDCYTKEEIDSKLADILGLDAEGVAELKALIEDDDALTGLLSEIARKANTADLAEVATSGSYNDLSDKPDLDVYCRKDADNTHSDSVSDTYVKRVYYEQGGLLQVDKLTVGGDSIKFYHSHRGEDSKELSLQLDDVEKLKNLPTDAELSEVATSGSYNDLKNKPDLSSFITRSVDDLTYYYTKLEIDTMIGNIETLLAAI